MLKVVPVKETPSGAKASFSTLQYSESQRKLKVFMPAINRCYVAAWESALRWVLEGHAEKSFAARPHFEVLAGTLRAADDVH